MGPRWPQVGLKLGHDELGLAKMGIRWVKMGKISHKMKQDSAKMRKMVDLPRVFHFFLRGGAVRCANNSARRGPKRVPRGPQEAQDDAKMAQGKGRHANLRPGRPNVKNAAKPEENQCFWRARCPQGGPQWAQDGFKIAQDGPRWPQDGPKMGHDGSKMAPRGSKIAPRWLQDGNETISAMINATKIANEANMSKKPEIF